MKGTDLFSEKWCKLVFAHRNKDYGAYILRRETGHRYAIAIGILFAIIIIAFAPIIIYSRYNIPHKVKIQDPMKHITRFEGVRIKEARPVRQKLHKQVTTSAEAKKNVTENDIISDHIANELPEDGETDLNKLKEIVTDSLETLLKEANLELAKNNQQTTGSVVDSIPRYPTGLADFMKWLDKYMVYPRVCTDRKQSGKVVVAFIVESTGAITDIRIIEGDIRELNHEVLRVLRKMPNWIPGKRNGKPIRSQVTLPVEFQFDDEPFS